MASKLPEGTFLERPNWGVPRILYPHWSSCRARLLCVHHLSLQASHLTTMGSFDYSSIWIDTCASAIQWGAHTHTYIYIYIYIIYNIYLPKSMYIFIYIYIYVVIYLYLCIHSIYIYTYPSLSVYLIYNMPEVSKSSARAPRPHLLGACSLRWPPAQQLTRGSKGRDPLWRNGGFWMAKYEKSAKSMGNQWTKWWISCDFPCMITGVELL